MYHDVIGVSTWQVTPPFHRYEWKSISRNGWSDMPSNGNAVRLIHAAR
jgi:hypothetical protein